MPPKPLGRRQRRVYKAQYDVRRRLTHRYTQLTLTREEADAFQQLARDYGLSLPKTILALARAQAGLSPAPVPHCILDSVKLATRQFRSIGNLLNQWTRQLHRKAQLTPEEVKLHREREAYLHHQLRGAETTLRKGFNLAE